jgi:hypothetical protein
VSQLIIESLQSAGKTTNDHAPAKTRAICFRFWYVSKSERIVIVRFVIKEKLNCREEEEERQRQHKEKEEMFKMVAVSLRVEQIDRSKDKCRRTAWQELNVLLQF